MTVVEDKPVTTQVVYEERPVTYETVQHMTETQFGNSCQEYIQKMSQCHSQEEYNKLHTDYETFVNAYAQTHNECSYPSAPAYHH